MPQTNLNTHIIINNQPKEEGYYATSYPITQYYNYYYCRHPPNV